MTSETPPAMRVSGAEFLARRTPRALRERAAFLNDELSDPESAHLMLDAVCVIERVIEALAPFAERAALHASLSTHAGRSDDDPAPPAMFTHGDYRRVAQLYSDLTQSNVEQTPANAAADSSPSPLTGASSESAAVFSSGGAP